jgi:hypothetical protein
LTFNESATNPGTPAYFSQKFEFLTEKMGSHMHFSYKIREKMSVFIGKGAKNDHFYRKWAGK